MGWWAVIPKGSPGPDLLCPFAPTLLRSLAPRTRHQSQPWQQAPKPRLPIAHGVLARREGIIAKVENGAESGLAPGAQIRVIFEGRG